MNAAAPAQLNINVGATNATAGLVLQTGGKVGIGTTSPNSLLSISGSGATLTINDTRNISWSIGDIESAIHFTSDDGSGGWTGATRAAISTVIEDPTGQNIGLEFSTHNNAAAVDAMRIDHLGNVASGRRRPRGLPTFG